MKKTFFTIIIVSYNAGDKLLKTVESVVRQTYTDYKILVKDGMSTDGSIEKLKKAYQVGSIDSDEDSRITLLESCDNGIYHAMNIAAAHLEGKVKAGENPSYVFFLNCGDYFKNENVLRDVHKLILDRNLKEGTTLPAIFYGDIYDRSAGARVASNPRIDDHACYRNVPSHQACFYDERLVYRNPFDLKYKVRADYEQFLRCYYREKAETVYMPVIIADYEGGGYSAKNLKLSETERREIIQMYLTSAQIRKYDILRVLTLSKLRTALSSNRLTAGLYNSVKELIYLLKRKR
ncbi:MAG: glycosyltransferase [Butyrivibrio sp.]|nr:glycosyltransferase [Butyrivibrio sp.]